MTLSDRKVGTRSSRPVEQIVQFSLDEIYSQAIEGLQSVRTQIDAADTLRNNGLIEVSDNILRDQITRLTSVYDLYANRILRYCYLKMFIDGCEKTDAYNRLSMRIEDVDKLIACPLESETIFTDFLHRQFETKAFASGSETTKLLTCIGIDSKEVYRKLYPSFHKSKECAGRQEELQKIFKRRNSIVHDNDKSKVSGKQFPISKDCVMEYYQVFDNLINIIYREVKKKY